MTDDAETRAQTLRQTAVRAGRTASRLAGLTIAVGVWFGGLPLWLLIPAISFSVAGAPLVSWIVGNRLATRLPEDERVPAVVGLDETLKGGARLGSIRGGWVLRRTVVGTLLVVVACLVLLSL